MKNFFLPYFLIFTFIVFYSEAQEISSTIKRIVIDPGHGGKDPGNLGTGRYKSNEKDIALKVALKVGGYIEKYIENVEVIYTRKTDVYPTLGERTRMANKAKADLFISIHCDAFGKESAHGCSSLVLGGGKKKGENRIAIRENAVILKEENYETNYDNFNPKDEDSFYTLLLYQSTYREQSLSLASKIQDQFRRRVSRTDRGVKQQPLWVTARVSMPAVLVELGFLTNKKEEDFLNTEKGQDYMASAIFRAFRDYKVEQDALVQQVKAKSELVIGPAVDNTDKTIEKIQPEDLVIKEEEPTPNTPKATAVTYDDRNDLGVFYGVQIFSSQGKAHSSEFAGLNPIVPFMENGLIKYIYGKTNSLKEADTLKEDAKNKGFMDCFIVGMYKGQKKTLSEARALLNK
mgnify:CR=1 FL=1